MLYLHLRYHMFFDELARLSEKAGQLREAQLYTDCRDMARYIQARDMARYIQARYIQARDMARYSSRALALALAQPSPTTEGR